MGNIEASKRWQLKNKDRVREVKKQYYQKNKEKLLVNMKKWKESNKEHLQQYILDNKEKTKEVKKQYYIVNKEKIDKQHRNWVQNHQLIFLGKAINLDNIERTLSCMCCRFQGRTNLHHIKYDLNDPLKYTIELCSSCHMLWHFEENYLRFGKKKLLPAKELIVENTMELATEGDEFQ